MSASQLLCRMRKVWVPAHPEEVVRQRLISHLIDQLGYPEGMIAIERSLHSLPWLTGMQGCPDRRADLIVFTLNKRRELVPLLLVECKAVPLTAAVERQVTGYNHYVGSPFVAIVNADTLRYGWQEASGYVWEQDLPDYATLAQPLD